MYWINPCHFALEGILSVQYHGDSTIITTDTGDQMTAEKYVSEVEFTRWSIDRVGFDILALCLIILGTV